MVGCREGVSDGTLLGWGEIVGELAQRLQVSGQFWMNSVLLQKLGFFSAKEHCFLPSLKENFPLVSAQTPHDSHVLGQLPIKGFFLQSFLIRDGLLRYPHFLSLLLKTNLSLESSHCFREGDDVRACEVATKRKAKIAVVACHTDL